MGCCKERLVVTDLTRIPSRMNKRWPLFRRLDLRRDVDGFGGGEVSSDREGDCFLLPVVEERELSTSSWPAPDIAKEAFFPRRPLARVDGGG